MSLTERVQHAYRHAYYGFYDLRMLDERCFVSTIESARARDEVPRIARALDLLGGTRRSRFGIWVYPSEEVEVFL